ncbi:MULTISPECIES: aminomethyl-transferring glycine dehydrogenase [unclassified Polaromonas]|uniref:aminomethyl-transferring glycine dehydrogenase n=1 Tax=unclassified Polaromonas TaxID=2638319 RepID=UPI000F07FDE1|nr:MULTISPECIES: aminomethyl-transferring glycine dehydrogenase [unclassified Polaromonas]AYQ30210.1 glycine dehydrogenase (aminomethyl-transferring) [Polaromonas sp. SP1]QGJ18674.1 aminomethyl-transferring glycine dehydrogenase [Polaromonas sp. Pch-P]
MLMQSAKPLGDLENPSEFIARHIGIDEADEIHMLSIVGSASRRALVEGIVPRSIARSTAMAIPAPVTEAAALKQLKAIAAKNQVFKNFIGQGYYGTYTPGVILRNILENPAWYTAYTPYQAEISQGRMEALINFQTMVCDLTGMPIANASMLDEATAAAEAMTLAKRSVKSKSNVFIVAGDCHPQTIEVIQTRARPLGIEVKVSTASVTVPQLMAEGNYFGVLAQYPATTGSIHDLRPLAGQAHVDGAALCVAADLLALTLLTPPGEWDADIVLGNTQRFGMPMGNGGPHAAYLACRDEFKRSLPGRLVGVTVDSHGNPTYRLALQTREQHIRREKATSNICTAQVLPAVIASMYAVYHGPQGLKRIAERVAAYTAIFVRGLQELGYEITNTGAFDSVTVKTGDATNLIAERARSAGANLRFRLKNHLGVSLDETTSRKDIELLWSFFAKPGQTVPVVSAFEKGVESLIPADLRRTTAFLTHPVFNTHHSETGMLRYIRMLSDKDLALDRSMIPLGSCTMKLNATSEMVPITWPEFANIHPFAPAEQLQGYAELDKQLRDWLCQATGYAGISLQPNAGSQGEYAGLLVIKAFHEAKGQGHRNICLIPSSAHGTNPASAQMVGMTVVVTACDAQGNVDMADLKAKCEQHSANLACVMITYPSTHGVFETQVKELCAMVHSHGGRVYVDGANMNALVGVAAPGEFGGDVSHLNLHKTFCIPHGGGGPGVGPVCVVADLVPYLPGHATAGIPVNGVGAVSAAPLGNAAVLPISWMYCRMMGPEGLTQATEVAILSANYISSRLKDHFPTLYASENGHVAHECILDLRPLKETSGVTAEDVAKRLMDYGFHAPTLSFPVPGTLMVEPTESETLAELDRFIDAMIAIREEIRKVEAGQWPQDNNPLKHAPHTAASLMGADWDRPYPRETGAFPLASLKQVKYWPPVGRVDNVYGDRNLFCSCVPVADYA